MLPARWPRFLLLIGLGSVLALAPGRAQAQGPALLLGQWEMRQISFTASQAVSPEVLARMDNPEVAKLNRDMAGGAARLLVEFRADGTYQFTVAHTGQPNRVETGTYFVKNGTLFAQSPGTEGGSSFNDQRLLQLSRRKLVVSFLVGAELPEVEEEVEYRRIK